MTKLIAYRVGLLLEDGSLTEYEFTAMDPQTALLRGKLAYEKEHPGTRVTAASAMWPGDGAPTNTHPHTTAPAGVPTTQLETKHEPL